MSRFPVCKLVSMLEVVSRARKFGPRGQSSKTPEDDVIKSLQGGPRGAVSPGASCFVQWSICGQYSMTGVPLPCIATPAQLMLFTDGSCTHNNHSLA